MNKISLLSLPTTLLCLALVGCGFTDPEFAGSARNATTAVNAKSIVGKWYARSQSKGIVTGDFEAVMDLRADGTGQLKGGGHGSAFMNGKVQTGQTHTIEWTYAGAGVWKFKMHLGVGTNQTGTFRLANGRLLQETKLIVPTAPIIGWGLLKSREVFVRAGELNALKDEALRDNLSR